MSVRHPPQQPVEIPDHLGHGSSYVHRHYRCRCGPCQDWRRSYDRARDCGRRHGRRETRRRLEPGGWYVCVDRWGEARGYHVYEGTHCVRCSADRATEELWEERWSAS